MKCRVSSTDLDTIMGAVLIILYNISSTVSSEYDILSICWYLCTSVIATCLSASSGDFKRNAAIGLWFLGHVGASDASRFQFPTRGKNISDVV